MPEIALFLIGLAVTAAVLTAFALLVRSEIQDGRIDAAEREGRAHELDETVSEITAPSNDHQPHRVLVRRG
jgi:hypothetical protein